MSTLQPIHEAQMSPNPPTSHPLMKMGFRKRWQAKFILSPYPIQAAGFTLIELSIVLVIIGLIVGGVLVGRDLLEAAKWKKMHSQLQEYETAAMTFRLKYGKIPGDIDNASLFFGTYCQKSGFANVSCNGNDNGVINQSGIAASSPAWFVGYQWGGSPTYEHAIFWRHLYLAGLMTQEVTGEAGSGVVTGVSTPSTEFSLGIGIQGKAFFVGNYRTAENVARPSAPTPWNSKDLYRFDQKFDDSLPQTGKIKGLTQV